MGPPGTTRRATRYKRSVLTRGDDRELHMRVQGDDVYREVQVVQSGGRASADTMSGGARRDAPRQPSAEGAACGRVQHHTISCQLPNGRDHIASLDLSWAQQV